MIVVCPPAFRESLEPWLGHRRDEGLSVDVVACSGDAKVLMRMIQNRADDQTTYVMLVGDAPAIGTPCDPRRQVPTSYIASKVTAAWGSTPTLATDMPFGDFDGDQIPDAVVGRLPVDRPEQLSRLIDRIIWQENSTDFGTWRGKVQLVGGVGGFGTLADATIESVTRALVTSVLPLETRTSVAYASPGHPFFPSGQSFTDAVLDRYQSGARFWVYAGHGQVDQLDRVPATADGIAVLDGESVKRLRCQPGRAPIGIMLACYTGAIDAPQDSLAERMLLENGGPIAVLAGSRVTMPYGNTTAAVGLIEGVFQEKLPRLGDAWLSAMRQMHRAEGSNQSNTRLMIDTLAAVISPAGSDLVEERREHMGLYNLLGDPALRMHQPLTASVHVNTAHDPGTAVTVSIRSPIPGHLSLSLDRPLGGAIGSDANATTVAVIEQSVVADRITESRVVLPPEVIGPVIVRACIAGDSCWATGAARTLVRPPKPERGNLPIPSNPDGK